MPGGFGAQRRIKTANRSQVAYLNNKELQIEELITPTIEALDAQVWGVEYLSQGKYSLLRIYI